MLGEGRNCGPLFLCRVLVERPLLVVLTSCTQLGCMQRGSEDTESNYADILFHNGFDEGIDALKGPEPRVIDLGGKMDDDVEEIPELFNNPPAGGILTVADNLLSEPRPPAYWH